MGVVFSLPYHSISWAKVSSFGDFWGVFLTARRCGELFFTQILDQTIMTLDDSWRSR